MSGHSLKSKRRHPDSNREQFRVAHVTFEIIDHPQDGVTFALIAGDAVTAKDRRPLFSGYVTEQMHEQLRALAFRLRQLQDKVKSEATK